MDEKPDEVLNAQPGDTFAIPLLGMSGLDGGGSLDQYSSVQVTDWGDGDDDDWNAAPVSTSDKQPLSPIHDEEEALGLSATYDSGM